MSSRRSAQGDRRGRLPAPVALGRAAGPVAHLAWGVGVIGQIVGAALVDDGDDLGRGMIAWVASGLVLGVVTTAVVVADAPSTTPTGRPGRRRPRTGRPWDAPAVIGYLAVWIVAAALISPIGLAYGAVMLVVAGLGGVCVYLAIMVEIVSIRGLRGFGAIVLGRVPDDEGSGSRWSALGPFVATLGASLWFLPVVGVLGYDSPHRRDLLPLVGVLRDGVETTRPAVLLVGQIGTALVLGLIALGTVLSVVTARLRRT